MEKNSTILVTGSSGLLGTSLIKKLKSQGYKKILDPSSGELDLRNQNEVDSYFRSHKISYVFHLAARIGGFKEKISAPAEFFYDNLLIACNAIEASRKYKVKKLVFIGTVCVYPNKSIQPIKEEYIFDGKLEPVSEAYGLAKISGLKFCGYCNNQYKTNFISLVPCNLYGPNDNFGDYPHLIPHLISKLHDAKRKNLNLVKIKMSGNAVREFLFADDLSEAMLYFVDYHDLEKVKPFLNIGYGKGISIVNLALLIKKIVDYKGEIKFDEPGKEEMPKRVLDTKKANNLGWKPKITLEEGLKITYEWFLKNKA